MRRIIVGAQVSMDGVMQAPGGPTEDPTKGFRFGGWAMPYFDQAFAEEIDRLFENFDLLLGRKTYEIFAGYWPYQDEDSPHGGIAKAFNNVGLGSLHALSYDYSVNELKGNQAPGIHITVTGLTNNSKVSSGFAKPSRIGSRES